jgi:hypothetical protein
MKMILVNQVTGRDDIDTGEESVTPTIINAESARIFYPRKKDSDGVERVGTRITFDDGGGWPVADTFDDLKAKFAAVGVSLMPVTMVVEVQAIIDEDTGEMLNSADEGSSPAMVQPAFIRCFYPRKDSRIGTRITFAKGSGVAIKDLFETVAAALGQTVSRPALAAPTA